MESSDGSESSLDVEGPFIPLCQPSDCRTIGFDVKASFSNELDHTDNIKLNIRKMDFDDSNRAFCFETEELALKGNSDYKNVLQAIVMLEAQEAKAFADCARLKKLKSEALSDPFDFMNCVQNGKDFKLPKRQKIHPVPAIDWGKYAISGNVSEFAHRQLLQLATQVAQSFSFNRSVKDLSDISDFSGSNDAWSPEELKHLKDLLEEFPPDDIDTQRWIKIANALGKHTPLQVASKVRQISESGGGISGLNYPSRFETLSTYNDSVLKIRDENYTKCRLELEDMEDMSPDVYDSPEFKELVILNSVLKDKLKSSNKLTIHKGHRCCRCKNEPIVGTRWHCIECKLPLSIDFCEDCVESSYEVGQHTSNHKLEEIFYTAVLDKDYMHFLGNDYNYLDPNYMPAAT